MTTILARGTIAGTVVGFLLFTFLFVIGFSPGPLSFAHPLVPIEGLLAGAIIGFGTTYLIRDDLLVES